MIGSGSALSDFVYKNLQKKLEGLQDIGSKSVFGENNFRSSFPNERVYQSISPECSVILKKKCFSTLKFNNDLKWLDSTEKLLLRCTKALFAYKVQQIRSYEALTKYDSFFNNTGEHNLFFLYNVFRDLNLLTIDVSTYENQFEEIIKKAQREKITRQSIGGELRDIAELARRFAFSGNYNLTTWHIDPESQEDIILGPGTGTIELTNFSSINTNVSIDTAPSSLTLSMEDPLDLATIREDDIEFAIEEGIGGAHSFFEKLVSGSLDLANNGKKGSYDSDLSSFGKRFNDPSRNTLNSDIDYIRERLRVFYLGKPIVNPADGIHVFLCSNRGKSIKNSANGFSNIRQSGFDAISFDEEYKLDDIVLEAERRLFTSGKLSIDDYKQIRKDAEDSFKMIHVYAGYVTSAATSYSSGKYNFNFSATDNMGWLQWSSYQKVPALEDVTGVLEDPLTPYKIDVDEFGKIIEGGAPELLDENKQLLEGDFLSYKSGVLKGQQAYEGNLYQGQFNGFGSIDKTKILQHPDGFIYRWKKGIISATASVQPSNASGSGARNNKLFAQRYGITPADDILANLDVANIISVLITGQPYNIDSFLEKSMEAASTTSGSNSLGQNDPLSFLVQSVKKQNPYYGNFKPYRTVTLNKKTVAKTIQDKIRRDNLNSEVILMQKRKVKLFQQSKLLDDTDQQSLKAVIDSEIAKIDKEISNRISALKETGFESADYNLTFNFSFGKSQNKISDMSEEDEEKVSRAMLHVGSLRRIEDVRLNRDSNYLIVSDQYDYNLELVPFLLKISQTNYKKFQGDYTSVLDRCTAANNAIGFELFANSQGHIEFRPPQWNRTPLSILEYAAKSKKEGKTVIPENIMSLFDKRIEGLEYEIQKTNILIVMSALLLGKFPDKSLIPGYKGISGVGSLSFFGVKINIHSTEDGKSKFKSKLKDAFGGSGSLSGANRTANFPILGGKLKIDFDPSDGKVMFGDTTTILGEFDPIVQEDSGAFNRFLSSITTKSSSDYEALNYANAETLNQIRKDCIKFVGFDPCKSIGFGERDITKEDFIFNGEYEDLEALIFNSDSGIFKKLAVFISSRDKLVTILKRNTEKKKELEAVEVLFGASGQLNVNNQEITQANAVQQGLGKIFDDSSKINPIKIDNKILEKGLELINAANEILSGSPFDGNVFEHLILNDRSNILGFGSGKRFLIGDEDIISANYSEKPPEFTRINVVGDVPLNVAQAANSATDGLYYWAGATDFDLTRQYGYKPLSPQPFPFLSDAELACRPYAYFKVQNQRAKILQASVTLIGNEFYQPGDVVYIKSRNILYYVQAVSHSFSVGQSFTTTLNLIYGHAPGEYLPGPLDIIGQQMYTSYKDNTITQRQSRGDDNYRVMRPGSMVVPPFITGYGSSAKLYMLRYADNQTRFLRMIMDSSLLISSRRKLLLRAFIAGKPSNNPEGSEAVNSAKNYLNIVKSMFTNPEMVTRNGGGEISLGISQLSGSVKNTISSLKSSTIGDLEQVILPNGALAMPVKEEDIIIQVSFLKKDNEFDARDKSKENSSNISRNNSNSKINELPELGIQCFDRDLLTFLTDKSGDIRADARELFPAGGPSQSTWLDISTYGLLDLQKGVIGVVEVGIIDIGEGR